MLASVSDLPGIFAAVIKQGAQVVAIRALSENGEVANPPASMENTAGADGGEVINSVGFAWIANHQNSGKAWLQVQVQTFRPPFDRQVSDFIEPGQAVANYVATGMPVGVAVQAQRPASFVLTGTSSFNESSHTEVATFKPSVTGGVAAAPKK
jgi:hypothetical protein